ncbi:SafA/ExsA family spore coat assembly protein [Bacillus tuaregi]|uniref:SafA/ExsA family spore coat assembly protein n=1 Tax=Bacillus tuaregi TaxID=1816695 RepID=UPI0008F93389|nr:SafA/ExsA family spore coat assembly protein [Bacillus tuaregi]
MKIHIVQKGDTLWKIAKKYGVDFEELKKMNSQLSNPDMIMPGMKIKVPTSGGNIKKEAPTGVQGAKINMGAKKEMPKQEFPIMKEKPKEEPKEEPKAEPVEPPKPAPIEVPKAMPEAPKPAPKPIQKAMPEAPKPAPKPIQKAMPEAPKPAPKPIQKAMPEAPKPVPKAKPKELPKEAPKVKPMEPIKEVPKVKAVEEAKKPYLPKMPLPISEADINNYFMSNMANVNVPEPPKSLPKLPPKPLNVLPEVNPVFESPEDFPPIPESPIDQNVGGQYQPMYPYMPNYVNPCFDPCYPGGQPMPYPQVQGMQMPAQMPYPQVQGMQMPAQMPYPQVQGAQMPCPPVMGAQMHAPQMPCPPLMGAQMPSMPMNANPAFPQVQGAYMPEAPIPNQPGMVAGIQDGPDMYEESSPFMPQMFSPETGQGMPSPGNPEMGAQTPMMPMDQPMPMMGQQMPQPMPMMGQQMPQPMPMMGQQMPQPMPMMGQQMPQPMPMMGQQMPQPMPMMGQQMPQSMPMMGQQMPQSMPMMGQQMPQSMPMMGQQMPQQMPMMGQQMPHQMPQPMQEKDCGCGGSQPGYPMEGFGGGGYSAPPMSPGMPGGFFPGPYYPQMGFGQPPYGPYMQAGVPDYGAPMGDYGVPYDFGPGYPTPRDEESSEYND